MTLTLNSTKSTHNGHAPAPHNGHAPSTHNGHAPSTLESHDPSTQNGHEQSSATTGIRVILADSQTIYRVGMKKVFALEDDIRVVAQAESFTNLLAALQRYPTDVVVLEGQLIAGTVDAIPELVKHSPNAKIIVQVVESDEDNIVELYVAACAVLFPAPSPRACWSNAFARSPTARPGSTTSPSVGSSRHIAPRPARSPARAFCPRSPKKSWPSSVASPAGMRNKEIAYQIGTTEQVIKNYLRKVYDKLGVSDRLELALYCLHHQLLKNYVQEPEVIPLPPMAQATPLRAKM